jgi:CubicO group peptidase (beta-lactamase class C family)
MIEYFPEFEITDINSDANKITIRHLLTMSAGFGPDDAGTTSPDQIKFMLNKFLKNEPGKIFAYNSTNAHLHSMMITKTTGLRALDFGKKYLFKPLGISNLQWYELSGYTVGGYGLQLTSRDMAKVGYLYLNKGRWNRRQILTQEWVEDSTRMQVKIPEEITGWVREYMERSVAYGYLWWVDITDGHPFSSIVWRIGQC